MSGRPPHKRTGFGRRGELDLASLKRLIKRYRQLFVARKRKNVRIVKTKWWRELAHKTKLVKREIKRRHKNVR